MMMKNRITKLDRVLALLLCAVMVLGMLPSGAAAEGNTYGTVEYLGAADHHVTITGQGQQETIVTVNAGIFTADASGNATATIRLHKPEAFASANGSTYEIYHSYNYDSEAVVDDGTMTDEEYIDLTISFNAEMLKSRSSTSKILGTLKIYWGGINSENYSLQYAKVMIDTDSGDAICLKSPEGEILYGSNLLGWVSNAPGATIPQNGGTVVDVNVQTATLTADAEGKWYYTVTVDAPEGYVAGSANAVNGDVTFGEKTATLKMPVDKDKLGTTPQSDNFNINWDGLGEADSFDQRIHTSIASTANVTLLDNAGNQVYPKVATNLYGTAAAITPDASGMTITGNGVGDITAVVNAAELTWVPANDLGRTEGWWVGIKVTAPEGFSESATYYHSDNSTVKSFATYKDGDNHIALWMPVTIEELEAGTAERIYYFDWEPETEYDQTISFKVASDADITLNNKDGQQIYPYLYGYVRPQGGVCDVTGNETAQVAVETVDGYNSITWNNGWTHVIEVDAPAGTSYQMKTFEKSFTEAGTAELNETYTIDWNEDGLVDQTITVTGAVNLVKTKQDAPSFKDGNAVTLNTYNLYGGYTNEVTSTGVGELTYEISENEYVTIDENGKVTIKDWKKVRQIKEEADVATITAYYAETETHAASAVSTYTLTISKYMDNSLKFDEENVTKTYGETSKTYQQTVSTDVKNVDYTVTYASSDDTIATVDASTGEVTFLKAGNVTITATVEYENRYTTTAAKYDLTIEKGEQELTFTVAEPENIIYSVGGTFENAASGGDSSEPIVYSIEGNAATIDETTGKLTVVKSGTVTVTANKAGDDRYNAAEAVSYKLTIDKADQEIAFATAAPAAVTYKTGLTFENTASGGEGTGTITYAITKGDAATVDSNGKLSISKSGTITVTATKAADDRYNEATAAYSLTINKADQQIAFVDTDAQHTLTNAMATYEIEMNPTANAYNDGQGVNFKFEIVSADDRLTVKEEGHDDQTTSVDETTGVITIADGAYGTMTVKVTRPGDDRYNDWEGLTYTLTVEQVQLDGGFVLDGPKNENAKDKNWYNGPVTVTYVKDGVKYEQATTMSYLHTWYGTEVTTSKEGVFDSLKRCVKIPGDHRGVQHDLIVPEFKIDYTAPVSTISYSESVLGKIAETVTFGYYKAPMTVTISAVDKPSDAVSYSKVPSGLYTINYRVDGSSAFTAVEVSGESNKITFNIDPEYRGKVEFYAVDMAGNQETTKNANTTIVVDSLIPTLDVTYTYDAPEGAQLNVTEGDIIYTQYKTTANLTITEANFDLAEKPVIKVHNARTDKTRTVEPEWTSAGDKNTASVVLEGDGDYTLTVEFADRSTNKMETYTQKTYIDSTKPVITLESKLDGLVTNGTVKTTVTIDEHNFNPAATTIKVSGVDIEGKTVVEEHTKTVTWNSDGDKRTAEIELKEDAIYTITVNSTDWAGNVADTASKSFTLENTAPTAVTFSYSTPVLAKLIEGITFGYYQAEVEVTMTAEDQTSGVASFAWTYTRQDGASDVKNVASKSDKIAYTNGGKTASVSFKLAASDLEQFRGSVSVVVTDNSGNSTATVSDTDDIIVVDSIKPVAQPIAWDEAEQVLDKELTVGTLTRPASTRFYDEKAVATVTITDANFYGEDVVVTDNGTATQFDGTWTAHATEKDTWVNTVTLSAEGDHVLQVTYTDRSGNVMEPVTSELVVLDHTAPVVSVNPENVGDRHYYNADQTITVKVVEHNFRESDVVYTISGKDVTGAELNPTVAYGEWKHDGDTHTIDLTFGVDANYTLDVDYKDLALVASNDLAEQLFTVDKVAPSDLKVAYSQSLASHVIEAVTFGYYNAPVTVTVSATDDVAGVSEFVYSYFKNAGVSEVNAELLNQSLTDIKQDGKTFSAQFSIPKDALTATNQFNGYVDFTAEDRSGWTTSTSEKETNSVVVDNITPTSNVTYNQPVQEKNNVAYYDGNINATIVINEANFFSQDVRVAVTKDGANFPVNVAWRDNSVDTHTGTFTLTEDGDYIVTVNYTDRSTNAMAAYTSQQLTIDTKAPETAVTKVVNNSANTDEVYSFTITSSDINFDTSKFNAKLTALVRGEDGSFKDEQIDLGALVTVEDGKTYSYNVENLVKDAIYTLTCTVTDLSGNTYSKVLLEDGKEYASVQFSINRDGSTFMLGEYTQSLVNDYYTQYVTDDVVIIEINPDVLKENKVILNGKDLTEGSDYTVASEGGNGKWMKYTYTVNKTLFDAEGQYQIVVSSTDKAGNNAFSDVKDATVGFVVDRTAPVITVTGMANDGRYQTESQTVTLIPADDGGALNSILVRMVDDDGQPLETLIDLSGEALAEALEAGDGMLTFQIGEGLYQNVQIICKDCAVGAEGPNVYDETFTNLSVSASGFMIFWANRPLRWGVIICLLLLLLIVIYLLTKKKKKKEQ